jgi:hypothetical protein
MKYIAAALALATTVAGHGYVNTATIGGKTFTFYQPYQDPYMSPATQRISRPIQGNGPVEDVTLADLQCGGYTAGGICTGLNGPTATSVPPSPTWRSAPIRAAPTTCPAPSTSRPRPQHTCSLY